MKRLCVVVHDVAPKTWPQCESLLAMLDALGASPVTLLVVPDFHGSGAIDEDRDFVRAIDRRRARGDEIALHGYFHRDDGAAPRSALAWLRRRVLTAGEGEFAELDANIAETRLLDGLRRLARLGWHADGFVAPAWLTSRGTHEALRRVGLRWTSSHGALIDLERGGPHIRAACLTASPRSRWRRRASIAWLRIGAKILAAQPLVRVGLHPGDADHRDLMACWHEVVADLLARRSPITKMQAIGLHAAHARVRKDARYGPMQGELKRVDRAATGVNGEPGSLLGPP